MIVTILSKLIGLLLESYNLQLFSVTLVRACLCMYTNRIVIVQPRPYPREFILPPTTIRELIRVWQRASHRTVREGTPPSSF